jgi:hypothetical protein
MVMYKKTKIKRKRRGGKLKKNKKPKGLSNNKRSKC